MKQVNKNPTMNRSLSLATMSFTSTGEGGEVNGSGFDALRRGQSIILEATGGTAEGFTTLKEYFVIPSNIKASGTITVSDTPTAEQTLTVDDQVFTFKASRTEAGEVAINADADQLALNIAAAINADLETVAAAVGTGETSHVVTVTAVTAGTDGNSIVLLESATGVAVSGSGTLAGGVATDARIYLADTKVKAQNSVAITTTGDAGAGTVHPSVHVGGILYVGVEGDVNIRGIASNEFSVHKGLSGWVPTMVGSVNTYGTTATDIVGWES